MSVRQLDVKLLRDLRRLWPRPWRSRSSSPAGWRRSSWRSGRTGLLDETRLAYYERNRLADVFASVRRAPKTLLYDLARISGVAAVEARVAKFALLDIPGFEPPVTAQVVSLPMTASSTSTGCMSAWDVCRSHSRRTRWSSTRPSPARIA